MSGRDSSQSKINGLLLTLNLDSQSTIDLENMDLFDLSDEFINGLLTFEQRYKILEVINSRDRNQTREVIHGLRMLIEETGSQDMVAFACHLLEIESDVFVTKNTNDDLCQSIEQMSISCTDIQPQNNEIPCAEKPAMRETLLDIFMSLDLIECLKILKHENVPQYCLDILVSFMEKTPAEREPMTLFIDIMNYMILLDLEPAFEEILSLCIDWYINDSCLDDASIYNSILSIGKTNIEKERLDGLYYKFWNKCPAIEYQILAAQYLLVFDKTGLIDNKLLMMAQDKSVLYKHRADAIDVLLRLGCQKSESKARLLLDELSNDASNKISKTVYNSRQNVHESSVDASIGKILLELAKSNMPTEILVDEVTGQQYTAELTIDKCIKEVLELANNDNVKGSLMRIKIDQLLYPGGQTLATIFIRIYGRIKAHADKDLLVSRLIEELIEMNETCSSGHASRLVNVFSGVDWNINIGYKKQIQASIFGRLNCLIKAIPDDETICVSLEDDNKAEITQQLDSPIEFVPQKKRNTVYVNYKTILLEQLSNPEPENHIIWLGFFKIHIQDIVSDLYKEYVDGGYIGKEEFELHIRDAVSLFEIGS